MSCNKILKSIETILNWQGNSCLLHETNKHILSYIQAKHVCYKDSINIVWFMNHHDAILNIIRTTRV